MINVTLKDGTVRQYEAGTTAAEVAKSLGAGLYKAACAARLNGQAVDLLRGAFAAGAAWEGPMPGKSARECGNYQNLDADLARAQCRYYAELIRDWTAEKLAY